MKLWHWKSHWKFLWHWKDMETTLKNIDKGNHSDNLGLSHWNIFLCSSRTLKSHWQFLNHTEKFSALLISFVPRFFSITLDFQCHNFIVSRWWGCKAPKTPYFQRCCHRMTPYFCLLSLLSPKDLTFFGEMWALWSVSPKDPLFFAFGCHKKLLFVSISSTNWSFLPFSTIFCCCKFLLLNRSLKDQK